MLKVIPTFRRRLSELAVRVAELLPLLNFPDYDDRLLHLTGSRRALVVENAVGGAAVVQNCAVLENPGADD